MGGSRSYSVSSNGSVCSGGSSSGNCTVYSAAGSGLQCKATATTFGFKSIYSSVASKRGAAGAPLSQSQSQSQLQQQRVQARSQRIMCRCCLSEQQSASRQSLESWSDQELDEEGALLPQFMPLDTLAMVDLRDDKDSISSAADSSDSHLPHIARSASARDNKDSAMSTTATSTTTTLLDCLNACARIGASPADVELPQHICLDCCHTLEMCCEFIRCVRNADKILRRRCALPAKRARQPQRLASRTAAFISDGAEKGPAVKCRRRREEKVQPEKRSIADRAGVSAKGLFCNTPKSISLAKSAAATAITTATATLQMPTAERVTTPLVAHTEPGNGTSRAVLNDFLSKKGASKHTFATIKDLRMDKNNSKKSIMKICDKKHNAALLKPDDELLDICVGSECVESSFVRSFDSGIEIDEDLCSVKSSDCSANENPIRCHLAQYEGYTYVVADTLRHDLERFHRSGGKASNGGDNTATTYKCGFCIFECSARQELNKHLQIHLGPPQHSCRKCSFVGHFKYLLAQHMRSAHHCALGAFGTNQNDGHKNTEWSGANVAQSYQTLASAEAARYNCHLCGEHFHNYDALQQHRKSHKVFCKCTMCTYKSSTRENVLEHMAKEHKLLVERRLIVKYIPLQRINAEQLQEIVPIKEMGESEELTLLPKENKYRKHLCQFCGKCFDRRFHLLKHEYGVHRIEIDQSNSRDATTARVKLPGVTTTKHTKLKYLRQRNAVQAARQQRCIDDLALLADQQPGQDISSKFQCEICAAVFMFNFELKYHMRTHKVSTQTHSLAGKEDVNRRTDTPPPITVFVKSEELSATAVESAPPDEQQPSRIDVDEAEAGESASQNTCTEISNNMETALTGVASSVDMDLIALVTQQTSPLDSLEASPTSSNHSYDINYDDQLYLNDFDLGLLDCSGGFAEF